MTTFGSSTKRHHNNQHTPVTSFSILLLFLLVSILTQRVFASTPFIAPTCKAEQLPLAYVNKGNTNNDQPKPLMRAWMCHGNTHKEMVGKLAQVSTLYVYVGALIFLQCVSPLTYHPLLHVTTKHVGRHCQGTNQQASTISSRSAQLRT